MPLTVNSGEYRSQIGLDSVYLAEVTVDSATAYTADTPEYFAPAIEATIEPTINTETQYADDAAYDTMVSEGETKLTFNVTNIPIEMLAKITGKVFDSTTGRMYDNAATPPYMALGFRSLKSNGSYRYYWFLKGRFDIPKEAAATKGDAPDPKPQEITYTAINTVCIFTLSGSVSATTKRVMGDEDSTNFSGTGWFTQVQTPGVSAPSALALSTSTPADGGSNINVSANLSLTFNNAVPADAIANVVVVKADGTAVACTNSLDATKKIMTINPNASLDASSTYIVAYGVTDIYGQTLNGAINFGTA
jgi:phi13 family phage major tail protein